MRKSLQSKLFTIVILLCSLSFASAFAGELDGKTFCRLMASDGSFGQPPGNREVCLVFSNVSVRDYNYTLGGNPPLTFPYEIEDGIVKFNGSEYELKLNYLRAKSESSEGLIYLLKPRSFNEIRIPNSWINKAIEQGSLANEEQLKFLQQVVLIEIRSKRTNEESIKIINANLMAMHLPEIGPDVDIEIIGANGFASSTEGATIRDDKHQYCLPCQSGRNRYKFGITNLQK